MAGSTKALKRYEIYDKQLQGGRVHAAGGEPGHERPPEQAAAARLHDHFTGEGEVGGGHGGGGTEGRTDQGTKGLRDGGR